jgi:hypothetical protein
MPVLTPPAVETLIEYVPTTGTGRLFAACGSEISDVTSGSPVAASVTGLINARLQYVNFGTAGGQFAVCVNGADAPLNYNGSVWDTSPAITGPTAANLIWINAHQRRLWFGEENSLTAWYLPVNSIGGAALSFSVAGLATRGGYIMAMGTWTRDGGDGQDDVAVFLTSEGEAIIYQGTDPSSSTTWVLVGVFQIGKPIGRRCFKKAGADLLIVTDEGVVTCATVLSIDRSQTEKVALTSQVNAAFNSYVRDYGALYGWEPFFYPRRTMLLFNIPISTSEAYQIAFNTITRAPCRFTNIPAVTWGMRDNSPYFGSSDGSVYRFDNNATSDDGANIQTDALQAFSYFGTTNSKAFKLARPVFEATGTPLIALEMNTDFRVLEPSSVPTSIGGSDSFWDSATWDQSVWGGSQVYDGWLGVRGIGRSGALRIRTASTALTAGWIATDHIFTTGGQIT